MGSASCSMQRWDDAKSWARTRAEQQEDEEMPLAAPPLAFCCITPCTRTPLTQGSKCSPKRQRGLQFGL